MKTYDLAEAVKYKITWINEPSWEQTVQLNNKSYYLQGTWNNYGSYWYVDLFTVDRQQIIRGVKLTPLTDLLHYSYSQLRPKGFLVPILNTESVDKITFSNMGVDVELYFFPFYE